MPRSCRSAEAPSPIVHHTATINDMDTETNTRLSQGVAAIGGGTALTKTVDATKATGDQMTDLGARLRSNGGAADRGGQVAPPPGLQAPASTTTKDDTPEAQGQPDGGLLVSDTMFTMFLEECMLRYFAPAAAQPEAVRITPRSQIRLWADLEPIVKELRYQPTRTDPRVALGLAPSRSAQEQVTAVRRRVEFARLVLTMADTGGWASADLVAAEAAERALRNHGDVVLRELSNADSRRCASRPQTRLCQVLEAVGLQLLNTLREPTSVCGTQCSDHLGQQAQWPDNIVDPSGPHHYILACASQQRPRGRRKWLVESSPCGPPPPLTKWEDCSAASWCKRPAKEHAIRCDWCARWTSYRAALHRRRFCNTGRALGERWAGLLSRVEFGLQPFQQIAPGGRFAQVSWESLGLLTFRKGASLGLPTTIIPRVAVRRTIFLDYPTVHTAAIWRLVRGCAGAGWRFTEPQRSLASSKANPRLRQTLYSGMAQCAAADAAGVAQGLQWRMLLHRGFAALGDIFHDDLALMMTAAGPDAMIQASPSCTEMFPLSSRVAVDCTTLDEDKWEKDLCGWFAADLGKAMLHLRHKRLVNHGSRWVAAPRTVPRQRQLATREDDVSKCRAIQLQGPPGPRPSQVVSAVASAIHRSLGREVRAVEPDDPLVAYTLRPTRGVVAGAMTGHMELAVGMPGEARHLHEAFHGRGVQVGVDLLSLEFRLLHNSEQSGNGRRGERGGQPAAEQRGCPMHCHPHLPLSSRGRGGGRGHPSIPPTGGSSAKAPP